MFKARMITKHIVSALIILSIAVSAFAAGLEWSGGYPKLVKKDALLQWNPVKGATDYVVYRSDDKAKPKQLAKIKVNRYIDKNLVAGKSYSYVVAAVEGGSEVGRSQAGTVSIAKEAEKAAYIGLKVPKLQAAHIKERQENKYSVAIRWEGAGGTDFVGVNVYRSTKGKDLVMIGSAQGDSFEDTDVQTGQTYKYTVTAVDSQFKETKYSNEVSINIPVPVAREADKDVVTELQSTKMRHARLLFRIPVEGDKGALAPANAQGIAVDEAVGHIYVTSYVYGGVLVYDMNGKYQFIIRKAGINDPDKMTACQNVTLGENGNIYVTDFGGPTVYVYDFAGKLVNSFNVDNSRIPGNEGRGGRVHTVVLGPDGRVYVGDPGSNSVHVYDRNMKRLYEIYAPYTQQPAGKLFYNGPGFMTLAKNGDLVFVDAGYSRLMVFDTNGKFKRSIGRPGVNAGELYYPVGVAAGKDGEIFNASAMNPNIQAFSEDGKFLYALCNEKGNGPLDVSDMRGICIDSHDRMYVAEGRNNRVTVYQLLDSYIDTKPADAKKKL